MDTNVPGPAIAVESLEPVTTGNCRGPLSYGIENHVIQNIG